MAGDGLTLVIPGIAGPIGNDRAVTAAVLIAADGAITASSAPSRYPPGQPAADKLPAAAAAAIAPHHPTEVGTGGSSSAPYGRVSWALLGQIGPDTAGPAAYLYVQAPSASTGFVNPIRAWEELRRLSDTGPLLWASYVLLIMIVPVGILFGLLASRRLVRRVRRLEQAAVAVADGDYTITVPISGRDEIGRLEANFHHHDPAARFRDGRRTGTSHRRCRRCGTSPDRAGDPRRDLAAPVRPTHDRRRDAQGQPGSPAGAGDRTH